MQAMISILLLLAALAANAQPHSNDQKLFDRARSLWDQGQQEEALEACRELIKRFPASQHVPDAYLMVAEYYFDSAKLDKALLAYKKVTEFKDSKVFPYALYKTGWCYFNLQKFDKALAQFASVVKYCDKQQRTTGKQSELCPEALNDVTLAYSRAKGAKAAPAFIQNLAPNQAGELLLKLAGMYFGDGKYKDAMEVYRHLVGKAGCSADTPLYQLKIIDCVVRIGLMKNVPPEVRRLVELFAQLDKCLPKPTEEQKDTLDQARDAAEQTLYDLAVFSHEEAAATKDEKALHLTRELADSFLKLFPNSPHTAEIRGLTH